jgi:hypothetical protein
MAGKKLPENSKKAAGNAQKAAAAQAKADAENAKKAQAEAQEWSKGAKSNAKAYDSPPQIPTLDNIISSIKSTPTSRNRK